MNLEIQQNDLPNAIARLRRMQQFPHSMQDWVRESTLRAEYLVRHHLGEQGRGGTGPPLSDLTWEIYRRVGEPDGSGIRNHIRTEWVATVSREEGILGILDGKPTMIAKVQNDGAVIEVAPKMRGWFASIGLPLRGETSTIFIPPRSFWDNSQREAVRSAERDLRDRVRQSFR